MKNNQVLHINVDVYEDLNFLEDSDRSLLLKAIEISESAYAPYSNFLVGAALELSCGEIITGSNQENVAFPSGICAERTAFYYAGANYPNSKIVKVAVTAHSKQFDVNYPVSPCGACRQVMYEYESKQLTIVFPSAMYHYHGVSLEDYNAFVEADSQGKALNSIIKPNIGPSINAICFDCANSEIGDYLLSYKKKISIIAHIIENSFNNKKSIQLNIKDLFLSVN